MLLLLSAALKSIVGNSNVLSDAKATLPFRTGFRCGVGNALAVIRPRSLIEMWKVLKACVAANEAVIIQAANTGLTGGSTPCGNDYDRDVVIINTLALSKLSVIDEGRHVICLPGTTLYQIEEALKPFGREPHSVIGFSCIGACVTGGICNNSGGALSRPRHQHLTGPGRTGPVLPGPVSCYVCDTYNLSDDEGMRIVIAARRVAHALL